MKQARFWVAGAALLGVCMLAHGQERRPWEEYDQLVKRRESVTAYQADLFGDKVDLASGALSFSVTDISVPGNSSLPVALTRTLSIFNRKGYALNPQGPDGAFADWEFDTPHISGVFAENWAENRCTSSAPPPMLQRVVNNKVTYFYAEDYWHGNQANMPGGGELLWSADGTTSWPRPTSGGPYNWSTSSQTHFGCLPSIKNGAGEGFLAVTSDGTRYWFDWMAQFFEPPLRGGRGSPTVIQRRRNVLYATKVMDRHGNWVSYSYANAANAPGRLTEIASSDGRRITLSYDGYGRVSSATNHAQTWAYQYNLGTTATLAGVTLPDNSRWQLDLGPLSTASFRHRTVAASAEEAYRDCFNDGDIVDPSAKLGTVIHPSGAVGQFTVEPRRFGRSNVPASCINFTTPTNDPNDDVAYYPIAWDSYALTSKQVTGPGLPTLAWTYAYSSSISYYLTNGLPVCTSADCVKPKCVSDVCAGTSSATVTGPGGKWTRHVFGNSYRYNEGKLLRVERGDAVATVQTQRTTFALLDNGQCHMQRIGRSIQPRGSFVAEFSRPQIESVIGQDGATFHHRVNAFDCEARPIDESKWSSVGSGTKQESTEYAHDRAQWVLGQVERRVTNGVESTRTRFNTRMLPEQTYAFGKVVQTLGYHADGTVSTVTDGGQKTTHLSDWRFGIPGSIRHFDSTAQSAEVVNPGWISWSQDEAGSRTCYGYDAMGRVSLVTRTSETQANTCDTSEWNSTTAQLEPVTQDEYGIPAGHWRRTEQTGSARKLTYFDALWRPIVEESLDTADPKHTTSWVANRYDEQGRVVFQSFPRNPHQTGAVTWASVTDGTHTAYDGLDRPLRIEQDSEHGRLVTLIEYLPGFVRRTTNPKQQATSERFQVFESPSFDAPTQIDAPEGARTTIVRDVFGKPTSMTRSSSN